MWGTQGWNDLSYPSQTQRGYHQEEGQIRGTFGPGLVYTGSFKLRIWIFPHFKYRNDPGFAWFLKDPDCKNEGPILSILAIDITRAALMTSLSSRVVKLWLPRRVMHGCLPQVAHWPRGKDLWTCNCLAVMSSLGFPGCSVGKESACSAGNVGSISGSGKFPEGGHGTVLQYSCLENPMDRGAWQTTVLGVTKSQTRLQQVSTHTHTQQVVCRRCGEREKRKSYLRFTI